MKYESLDSKAFLSNIKKFREEQGITQKKIAEKMGISESFYCQLEGGKRKITIDYAISIANELSKSLDEIFLSRNFAKREVDASKINS